MLFKIQHVVLFTYLHRKMSVPNLDAKILKTLQTAGGDSVLTVGTEEEVSLLCPLLLPVSLSLCGGRQNHPLLLLEKVVRPVSEKLKYEKLI